jgi:hypothetical protein
VDEAPAVHAAEQVPFPVAVPYSTRPAPRPADRPSPVLDDAHPAALARRRERLAADRAGGLTEVRDDLLAWLS